MTARRLSLLLLAGVVAPLCAQELGDDLDALKESQQRLLEQMQENQQRIQELEQRLEAQETRPDPGTSETIEPRGDEQPYLDLVKWNELTVGESKIQFYGFLRLDLIYDESRPNNTQTIGFVRSEDNDLNGRNSDGDFTMHPRLTRLGLNLDGPVIEELGDAKLTGKLEIDFYNSGLQGQSESRAALRMRHAWLKLGWKDAGVSLLAGQTYDLISPLYPKVNPDLAQWGAGNLGDRRPQLRLEWWNPVGDGKIGVQGMIGLTGADDNANLDTPGTYGAGYRDGDTSELPTLQMRLGYETWLFGEKSGKFQIGIWGTRAWEDPDERIAGSDRFDSWGYGADLIIPLYENMLWIKGEIWEGQNLDDVRGGIFQGINTVTGDEIRSRGGFVELSYKPVDWYEVTGGWSTDDPYNKDLESAARASNQVSYFANRFKFGDFSFGLDYLYWKTQYIGFQNGDDHRFQA